MESVLKVMRGVQYGTAAELIRELRKGGAFSDLPEPLQNTLQEQVLMSLPALRNKLGEHAQGGDVVTVPQRYARLAVHLAAVFNTFLIDHHLQTTQPPAPEPEPEVPVDDHIPF